MQLALPTISGTLTDTDSIPTTPTINIAYTPQSMRYINAHLLDYILDCILHIANILYSSTYSNTVNFCTSMANIFAYSCTKLFFHLITRILYILSAHLLLLAVLAFTHSYIFLLAMFILMHQHTKTNSLYA